MKTDLLKNPSLPYIAPFAVYMIFLSIEQAIAGSVYWLYPLKTLAVAAAILWAWRGVRDDLRFATGLGAGAATGVLALAVWIAPELLHLTRTDFSRDGFNPAALAPAVAVPITVFRVAGAVLVVPIMEELFWRGWLLRWLIKEEFRTVPIGTFSWSSFGITVVLFGLEHWPNCWQVGLITGALYNGLLYRTRSLWACIVAHAVTNLLLATYVLLTGKWGYW